MDDSGTGRLEQIRAFLAGSGEVRFAGQRREKVYSWVEKTLVRLEYASLNRPGKGLVRLYIARMTGTEPAQATRLIAAYRSSGRVKAAAYQRTKFATHYTAADVDLLAYVDKAHGNLSGPATRRILEREFSEYSQPVYHKSRWRSWTASPGPNPTPKPHWRWSAKCKLFRSFRTSRTA